MNKSLISLLLPLTVVLLISAMSLQGQTRPGEMKPKNTSTPKKRTTVKSKSQSSPKAGRSSSPKPVPETPPKWDPDMAQNLANRAKEYLVNVRGIEPERIVTIDGGYREKPTVELWIVPKGAQLPRATPTMQGRYANENQWNVEFAAYRILSSTPVTLVPDPYGENVRTSWPGQDDYKSYLYKRFTDNYKNNQPVAYEAAKEYLSKYGSDNDQIVKYLRNWVAAYERSAAQQANRERIWPCPSVEIACPTTMTVAGEPITFTATVKGGNPNIAPTYNWSISAGTIAAGQGTSSITVDTSGLAGGSSVTATLSVGGYGPECTYTSSCTSGIKLILARKFDEYINIPFNEEKTHLDRFAVQLQNEPGAQGYIIAYGIPRSRASGYNTSAISQGVVASIWR